MLLVRRKSGESAIQKIFAQPQAYSMHSLVACTEGIGSLSNRNKFSSFFCHAQSGSRYDNSDARTFYCSYRLLVSRVKIIWTIPKEGLSLEQFSTYLRRSSCKRDQLIC